MSSPTEATESAVMSDQSIGCEGALTEEDPAQIGRRTQRRTPMFGSSVLSRASSVDVGRRRLPEGAISLSLEEATSDLAEIKSKMPADPVYDAYGYPMHEDANPAGRPHGAYAHPAGSQQFHPQGGAPHHQQGSRHGGLPPSSLSSSGPRPPAYSGALPASAATGGGVAVPSRSPEEQTELRRKIYRAELAREQLETQVASLKRHGRQATGDLEAHSLQLTSAAKALQLAARSGTRALVAERRKATAACSLVLALHHRKKALARAKEASAQLAQNLDETFGAGAAEALIEECLKAQGGDTLTSSSPSSGSGGADAMKSSSGRSSAVFDNMEEGGQGGGDRRSRSSSNSSSSAGNGPSDEINTLSSSSSSSSSGGAEGTEELLSAWMALCDGYSDDGGGLEDDASMTDKGGPSAITSGIAAAAAPSGRRQRKRGHHDGTNGSSGSGGGGSALQVSFTSCVSGLPFDRPLLLSPCSTLPDFAAGVSLAPQPTTAAAALPPTPTTATTTTAAATATASTDAPSAGDDQSKTATSPRFGHAAADLPLLARWERAKLLTLRAQGDSCQLRATLRSSKDAAKDFARMAADAAASREKCAAAEAAASAEFRSLVAKCASVRDARSKEFVGVQQQQRIQQEQLLLQKQHDGSPADAAAGAGDLDLEEADDAARGVKRSKGRAGRPTKK